MIAVKGGEVHDQPAEWMAAPHLPPGSTLTAAPRWTPRVLIVEDNPGDVRLVSQALAAAKGTTFESLAVGSLAEALSAIEAALPDLVLLDLGLPDAVGLSTLASVVAAAPDLPVIVLTGSGDEEKALAAIRMGAQDYLEKGELSATTLTRAARYAFERKSRQRVEDFISGAAQLLGSSLSMTETLARMAQLSVDNLCDYCAADLVNERGEIERLLVVHRDPVRHQIAEELRGLELDRARPDLGARAAQLGEAVLVSRVTPEHLASVTQSPEHAGILNRLSIASYIALPLVAHERFLGVLLLISSSRNFSATDLEVGKRFASIAAAAVDNARLFEQASEALRTRDRVLGIVAHDLRNPLSTIAMSADLLLDTNLSELQVEQQLQIVRRSAEHMNRLIEDLLDVARIEQGHLTLQRRYLDPARLVGQVTQSNFALATVRGLTLESSIQPTGPIYADQDRVVQVLSNLVGNAMKFTPSGGVVTIAVEQDQCDVQFRVADSGRGIPEEEMGQLFRPFWQGRGRTGQGAGLGLSIAKGIVEAHGGRIWATSEIGRGTTLSFTIPRSAGRRADDAEDADATS
jgi:signal transduction histidine kinase/DNA-binding response OmpR family regulator